MWILYYRLYVILKVNNFKGVTFIFNNRIEALNNHRIADKPYVIYWMESAQRTAYNHGLSYAIKKANFLKNL